jgi:hypothetical protein
LLDSAPFPGLQEVGVFLDLLDDVFLLHLALEAPEGAFQRLPVLDSYFGQKVYTSSPFCGKGKAT